MTTTTAVAVSALTWFELPTLDFDRARRFYETILEAPLQEEHFGDGRIAMFASTSPGIGGCLDESSKSTPSETGTVVYLNVSGRLDRTLELARANGAAVLVDVTALPPGMGHMAQIRDSEGNRIGLHAIS